MHKIVYLFTSGGSLLALAALFAIRTATQRFSTYNKGFQVRKTQSKPLLLYASALQRLLLRAIAPFFCGGDMTTPMICCAAAGHLYPLSGHPVAQDPARSSTSSRVTKSPANCFTTASNPFYFTKRCNYTRTCRLYSLENLGESRTLSRHMDTWYTSLLLWKIVLKKQKPSLRHCADRRDRHSSS